MRKLLLILGLTQILGNSTVFCHPEKIQAEINPALTSSDTKASHVPDILDRCTELINDLKQSPSGFKYRLRDVHTVYSELETRHSRVEKDSDIALYADYMLKLVDAILAPRTSTERNALKAHPIPAYVLRNMITAAQDATQYAPLSQINLAQTFFENTKTGTKTYIPLSRESILKSPLYTTYFHPPISMWERERNILPVAFNGVYFEICNRSLTFDERRNAWLEKLTQDEALKKADETANTYLDYRKAQGEIEKDLKALDSAHRNRLLNDPLYQKALWGSVGAGAFLPALTWSYVTEASEKLSAIAARSIRGVPVISGVLSSPLTYTIGLGCAGWYAMHYVSKRLEDYVSPESRTVIQAAQLALPVTYAAGIYVKPEQQAYDLANDMRSAYRVAKPAVSAWAAPKLTAMGNGLSTGLTYLRGTLAQWLANGAQFGANVSQQAGHLNTQAARNISNLATYAGTEIPEILGRTQAWGTRHYVPICWFLAGAAASNVYHMRGIKTAVQPRISVPQPATGTQQPIFEHLHRQIDEKILPSQRLFPPIRLNTSLFLERPHTNPKICRVMGDNID